MTSTRATHRNAEQDEAGGDRPLNPCLPLSAFYQEYYLPNCLGGAADGTRRQYGITLSLWERITGDPPLQGITNALIAKFRDSLLAMNGRGGRPYSPNTCRSKMVQIQAILDAAGPPGPRHRDAAGILLRVPWAKPPRLQLDVPQIVSMLRLSALYAAAERMTKPALDGIPPSSWWRALLAVCLNTALRRGTLFRLLWSHVDFVARTLTLPCDIQKARRGHAIPLNDTAVRHLESIRSTSGPVFSWPYSQEWFQHEFHVLQEMAGIPEGERFGLHSLRRTAATLLWKTCPEAAPMILGHQSSLVTLRHYVHSDEIARAALDCLPQPKGFRGLQPHEQQGEDQT